MLLWILFTLYVLCILFNLVDFYCHQNHGMLKYYILYRSLNQAPVTYKGWYSHIRRAYKNLNHFYNYLLFLCVTNMFNINYTQRTVIIEEKKQNCINTHLESKTISTLLFMTTLFLRNVYVIKTKNKSITQIHIY